MGAEKKKSKKRSAASSKPPPSGVRLYLDRNLGKYVIADALCAAGVAVEVHDDHLAANAPDEEWIALIDRSLRACDPTLGRCRRTNKRRLRVTGHAHR